jgi:hypothetical protein
MNLSSDADLARLGAVPLYYEASLVDVKPGDILIRRQRLDVLVMYRVYLLLSDIPEGDRHSDTLVTYNVNALELTGSYIPRRFLFAAHQLGKSNTVRIYHVPRGGDM